MARRLSSAPARFCASPRTCRMKPGRSKTPWISIFSIRPAKRPLAVGGVGALVYPAYPEPRRREPRRAPTQSSSHQCALTPVRRVAQGGPPPHRRAPFASDESLTNSENYAGRRASLGSAKRNRKYLWSQSSHRNGLIRKSAHTILSIAPLLRDLRTELLPHLGQSL